MSIPLKCEFCEEDFDFLVPVIVFRDEEHYEYSVLTGQAETIEEAKENEPKYLHMMVCPQCCMGGIENSSFGSVFVSVKSLEDMEGVLIV